MITPAATAVTTWNSRDNLTPAEVADLYQDAAVIISIYGYCGLNSTSGTYEYCDGISVRSALRQAACRWIERESLPGTQTLQADTEDLTEELEVRLTGVLYATGTRTRRTHIIDIADQITAWETETGRHTKDDAISVLETAATMFRSLTGDN